MALTDSLRRAEPPVAVRLRPGERPVWYDCQSEHSTWASWRDHAATAGLPVDVWLSLLLETGAVLRDIQAAGIDADALLHTAVARSDLSRLAPTPELRHWVALLHGGMSPAPDELPEVVLPARLVH